MLCQSIMTAQIASPTFTHVYAALVAIINTKFPNIGELLLKRLIVNFKRGFKRNDKTRCVSSSRYDHTITRLCLPFENMYFCVSNLSISYPTHTVASPPYSVHLGEKILIQSHKFSILVQIGVSIL